MGNNKIPSACGKSGGFCDRFFLFPLQWERENFIFPLYAARFPSIYNVAQIVCLNCFPLFIFHHGTYKVMEKRMRVQGSGFELRMELYSKEKGMVLKF